MSLRVLDDDRPGFAILLFSDRLEQSSLAISIRSLHENAFLGPDGKWQRTAHFFTTGKIGKSSGGTQYRVGPEIVNYLLEHDRILVADAEGTLNEETLWENAIPAMPGSAQIHGIGHSIYRPPVESAAAAIAPSAGTAPARIKPPEPQPAPPSASPAQAPVRRSAWRVWPELLALAAIAVVLVAIPQVRCGLFGMSCPVPEPAKVQNEDRLNRAMTCAAEREGPAPCGIEACFVGVNFSDTTKDVAAKVRTVLARAAQNCQARREAALRIAAQREAAQREAAQREAAQKQAAQKEAAEREAARREAAQREAAERDAAERERAQREAARKAAAEKVASKDVVANGNYVASATGCDMPAQEIKLNVTADFVTWSYNFKGKWYPWLGIVHAGGNIEVRLQSYDSDDKVKDVTFNNPDGHYSASEFYVRMRFRACGEKAITLTISRAN
jgi:hypothetical protein